MIRLRHQLVSLLGLSASLLLNARLLIGAQAQTQPFPTVPAPNATFPAPLPPGVTAQPGFGPVNLQPRLNLRDGLARAAGYFAAAGIALASGGAGFWLDRRSAKAVRAAGLFGERNDGLFSFGFRPRLRRMAWIVPSTAGLALLAVAASKCVPPKVCYATVGGVQMVVPCKQAEGAAKAQVTPTATPFIDCPDPGRGGTNAYEVANGGGTHSGYLDQARSLSDSSLRSALRSFELQVADHIRKMENPSAYTDQPWEGIDPREQQGVLRKWCGDMTRNRELADVILGIFQERGLAP